MLPDRWIIIPNWARFQHYADRAPLWIKVYLELNDRDDWRRLSLAQRGLVVSLWCEYGAANGLIRTSDVPGRIAQKVLGSTWDLLQREGWVELSASKPEPLRASAARARARTRARAETEVRERTPLPPAEAGDLKPSRTKTEDRPAARKRILERAETFTRQTGIQYEPDAYQDEIDKTYDLWPDEREQILQLYDELRGAALAERNGDLQDELPWEGEEPPVLAE